jgi:hypothetical protein
MACEAAERWPGSVALRALHGVFAGAGTGPAEALCPLNPVGACDVAFSAQHGFGAAHGGAGRRLGLRIGRYGREGQPHERCQDDDCFHKGLMRGRAEGSGA